VPPLKSGAGEEDEAADGFVAGKVHGETIDACDYLAKSFNLGGLIARAKALGCESGASTLTCRVGYPANASSSTFARSISFTG
jgi:DNA-binding response OmpR family regulator